MANFTTTVASTVDVFGLADTSKWQESNWNAFNWGEGSKDLYVLFTKVIDSTVSPTSDDVKYLMHVVDSTLTPDSDMVKNLAKVLDGSVTMDGDMYSETLTDGAGYNYVFLGGVTEAESRVSSVYSSGTAGSTTWASGTVTAATWS